MKFFVRAAFSLLALIWMAGEFSAFMNMFPMFLASQLARTE